MKVGISMKKVKKITAEEAISYRTPMSVTEISKLPYGYAFPRCPRCNVIIERFFQSYCDRCGQCLDWKPIYNLKAVERDPKE